ncbi:unnamed protein product [Urochloa humidicola]
MYPQEIDEVCQFLWPVLRYVIQSICVCEDALNEHIEHMLFYMEKELHIEDAFLKNMVKHPVQVIGIFYHLTRCSSSL